jgi:hypothetical protein
MTYRTFFRLVDDPQFQQTIQFAVWKAATDVLNDSNASAQRRTWAANALRGDMGAEQKRRVAIRCLMNPTIAAAGLNASDNDVQFVVNGLIAELTA